MNLPNAPILRKDFKSKVWGDKQLAEQWLLADEW